MIRRLIIVFMIIALCFLTGCYQIKYRVQSEQGRTYTNDRWNSYFLWGLAPVNDFYKSSEFCDRDRLVGFQSNIRPINFLDALVSFGLSSSNSIRATCVRNKNLEP